MKCAIIRSQEAATTTFGDNKIIRHGGGYTILMDRPSMQRADGAAGSAHTTQRGPQRDAYYWTDEAKTSAFEKQIHTPSGLTELKSWSDWGPVGRRHDTRPDTYRYTYRSVRPGTPA